MMPKLSTSTGPSSNPKVAYLCQRDATYALSQLATWESGACAIPLSTSSTKTEIEYFLNDSQAELVLCNPDFTHIFDSIDSSPPVIEVTHADLTKETTVPSKATNNPNEDGMIIYTSGTTGKPKGAVYSHGGI
jgi:acyl-CoA synthetase (AMP-forming)/AMP-acid ligase II